MTHYPKFFLNKGRILALWVMYTTYKQFKVQIIGIFEEIDSFYWPKMHLWKGDKKLRQGPPPPPLDKIQKNSNIFSGCLPYCGPILRTKCVKLSIGLKKKNIALGLCKLRELSILLRFHILRKKTHCFLEKITQRQISTLWPWHMNLIDHMKYVYCIIYIGQLAIWKTLAM